MWINSNTNPLKEGKYTCLVDMDGFGNLAVSKNNLFDGKDWCHFNSERQFIRYWESSIEDYKILSERLQERLEEHQKSRPKGFAYLYEIGNIEK